MSEENKNSITYDENWQSVTASEYATVCDEDYNDNEEESMSEPPKKQKKQSNAPKQYLIVFQLIVCIIIALAALVLQTIGGEIHKTVRDWYYTNLNKSVIFNLGDDIVDLSKFISGATPDEI